MTISLRNLCHTCISLITRINLGAIRAKIRPGRPLLLLELIDKKIENIYKAPFFSNIVIRFDAYPSVNYNVEGFKIAANRACFTLTLCRLNSGPSQTRLAQQWAAKILWTPPFHVLLPLQFSHSSESGQVNFVLSGTGLVQQRSSRHYPALVTPASNTITYMPTWYLTPESDVRY